MATLNELLTSLVALDEQLVAPIDPAELVGDIRGKIDSIHAVLERLGAAAAFLSAKRKKIAKTVTAIRRNKKRLEQYVAHEMGAAHFEMLPGNDCYARLQSTGESLSIARAPEVEDLEAWPDYIAVVQALKWREEKIAEDLASGRLQDCGFATLSKTKYVRFYEGEAKRGRKADT